MPFKFKDLFRSRKSRSQSPLPTPLPPIPEPSRAEPQDLAVQPSQTNIGPASTATYIQASPAPIGEGQNYGVKVLYDGGIKASVDIVFVHGLTGNAYNTWLHKDKGTRVHWPSELLKEDLPDARIMSFGYDADIVNFWNPTSNSRLSNHAENMVGDLVRKRERTNTEFRNILFVAHSLGGLVTEHALSYSRNTADKFLHQIERYTAGIVFLGVPHCGSDLASWASFGTRMVNLLKRSNSDIVGVLEPGSEMLRMVANGFQNILRRRKDEGFEIPITCFYEELSVMGVGEIVPLHSAEIRGYSCYGIHANHMDMTKFPNREDRGYDAILGELRRWKKSAYRALGNDRQSAVDKVTDQRENTSTGIRTEMGDRKKLTSGTMAEQGSNQFGESHAWDSQVVQGTFYNAVFNPKTTAWSDSTVYTDHETASRWMVPRSASRVYTGRREIGKRLARVLSFDPSTPAKEQRTFVIIGIGGTGKSEVCLKFAEDHRDEYWGVFWLDVRTTATAEQGYTDIGRRCGVTDTSVENVKSWLACSNQRWLLILDNADDLEIDYSEYMPPSRRGDILLTTRIPECGTYNTVGRETLGDLEPKLARELLLRATDIAESRWKEKEKDAMAVVTVLGSHTLAIIQAGAFVRQKLCTLEQYPTIFQQQREQLLKFHSKQNPSVYRNVYTTFEVSAEYLQNSKLPEGLDALNSLHTLAFMHNSGISETIFRKASEYASKLKDTGTSNDDEVLSLSVRHVARLPEYAQQGWSSLQDRLRWRKACTILESLSIITVREDDDSIAISAHSLVHAWAKERQDYQSRCRAWQSAATIIALSCEGWYRFCPFFIFLQPHVRACVSHEIEEYTQTMSNIEAAQILFQLAYVLYVIKDESSLAFLVQRIRSRLQNRYGADQEIALQIKIFTGRVFLQQGKYEEAVDVFRKIVECQSRALADDDSSRLASQHELAIAYQINGKVDEAIELLEHVVKIQQTLAEDHPDRLASQHALAIAYQANGQVDKAVELLKHVVKVRQTLAEDHPDRLASQRALAIAYQANGRVDEAVELLEHVVKIRQTLAEDHPDRLASQHALASAYRRNGKVDEAVELLEHVVKIRQTLAEDHPSRLASQHALAIAYQANGQVDKAVELLKHVVKIRQTLAEDHPDRLASQHALAIAYEANGQVDEAIELLEHVVKIRQTLAEDHPDRLASQHALAIAYEANGQVDEAIELLEHVVKIEQTLAEDHPDRLASQHALANAYRANGQVNEAVGIESRLISNHLE